MLRVFNNLIKNAIQSIPENQQEKWVVVIVTRQGTNVEITVTDNGVGIEEQNIPYIFEPKFTTKSSGMGLGLGIIKNIIENYKGTITFASELGKGTCFTVTLPILNS